MRPCVCNSQVGRVDHTLHISVLLIFSRNPETPQSRSFTLETRSNASTMPRKRSRAKKREVTVAVVNGTNSTPTPSLTDAISSELQTVTLNGNGKPGKRDIASEFNDYFGTVSNLANWQMLCRDVGVEEGLASITQCKKV